MIQEPYPTAKQRNSYEVLGRRLQRIIAAPGVQKVQAVVVSRREDESSEAWHQVIQEIGDTVGIRIERLNGDTVRIGWREYCDA
ncbi:DUF1654 domain-containing protein [Pseudomonas lurida]|uniref:DUF1654 domain-containing protein n=1 Tax=Pseudomonas TaxID=286 RepID=UPI0015E417FF|nr:MULTISPECIES: DUF1654 domain-containing protein [Pseudomonas]MBA1294439.1 DUF1654 domain-containing protein [Pseudomonas lurida]